MMIATPVLATQMKDSDKPSDIDMIEAKQSRHLDVIANLYQRYLHSDEMSLKDTSVLMLRFLSESKCFQHLYGYDKYQLIENVMRDVRKKHSNPLQEIKVEQRLMFDVANVADKSISPACNDYQDSQY